MQLDGELLREGDTIHHLILGDGTVHSTQETTAVATFRGQRMIISAASIMQNGVKVIGVQKPLVFWRDRRHNSDVSKYLPIIQHIENNIL